MSQFSKKCMSLSRKRLNNQDTNEEESIKTAPKKNSSNVLGTKFNFSITHEAIEDTSLISVDTPLKYGSCSNKYTTDEIKFSLKPNNILEEEYVSRELQSDSETNSNISNPIFFEETKIGSPLDVFQFPDEATHALDDTSAVFKSDNYKSDLIPKNKISRVKDYFPTDESDINTISDNDDVPIAEKPKNEKPNLKITEEAEDNDLNQCPICFKTTPKYINHMKSCAAKNNLTTQQLLSVLKLHKKQIAERKELGIQLPLPGFRAKSSPKRTRAADKKVPIDSNLQLALALSASLHSAEENELIQEAEALKEAGLSDEAEKKLSTLEKFGFATDLPVVSHCLKGSSKGRLLGPTILQKRTKEDRERIVTEKVAIVLISEEENASLDPFVEHKPTIKSKRLLKLWIEEPQLWDKSHCPSEEQRSGFYVQTLSKFIEPSTAEVGEGLKRLSQLAGRLNTPVQVNNNALNLQSPCLQDVSGADRALSSASTIPRHSVTPEKTNNLSNDWKKLVGDSFLSDMLIQCKHGKMVCAHKLVFYVRCPEMLSASLKKDLDKDVLILDDYTKDSVLSFLEFLYSGKNERMSYLSLEEFQSLLKLSEKYNYTQLKNELIFVEKSRRKKVGKNRGKLISKELFGNCPKNKNNEEDTNLEANSIVSVDSKIQVESIGCSQSDNERRSPDLFDEGSSIDEINSLSPERDDLQILASLVGKTSPHGEGNRSYKNMNHTSVDLDYSSILSASESTSMKRKAVDTSLSEEDDSTQCKRWCTDVSQSTMSDMNKEKDVLDLTQSSSSSKVASPEKNECLLDLTKSTPSSKGESPEKYEPVSRVRSGDCELINNAGHLDDCIGELTQQNPPASISPPVENLSQTRNLTDSFTCPEWDGFEDDCWYYNCEVNTPQRNSISKNLSVVNIEDKFSNISEMDDTHSSIETANKNCHENLNSSPLTKSRDADLNISETKFKSSTSRPTSSNENTPKKLSAQANKSAKISEIKYISSCDSSPKIISPHSKKCSSRKNLSFQFAVEDDNIGFERESSPKHISENQEESVAVETISLSPEIKNYRNIKKSLKKDSLEAIQRLLDDSFEINDSRLASIDELSTGNPSTHKDDNVCSPTKIEQQGQNNPVVTPSSEIYVSDNVTPLPNYSGMKTPALKNELRRFGLKPSLGKGKAKLLLRHIYEQTHPFVAEPVVKEPRTQEPPRSPAKGTQPAPPTVDLLDSEPEESCSQKSTCSSVSSSATLPEERIFESEEEILTQTQSSDGDIRTSIRNLIINDPELHKKILMYEPIFVEDLKAMLKDKGVKSKTDQIIEFLDEQCITFRTTSWQARNEKNRMKRKSPKKRAKAGKSSDNLELTQLSPRKNETSSKNKVSKNKSGRGRPRNINKEL